MTRKLAWVDNRGVNFFLSFDPPDGRPCHGECVCRKYESNQMDFEKQVHSCWLKRSLDRTVGSEESLCAEDSVPPLFVFGVEEFVSGPFISHHSAIDVIRCPIKSKAHPTLQVMFVLVVCVTRFFFVCCKHCPTVVFVIGSTAAETLKVATYTTDCQNLCHCRRQFWAASAEIILRAATTVANFFLRFYAMVH